MADEGFFSRWAKRKEAVRGGKVLPAEPVVARAPPPQPSTGGGGSKDSKPVGTPEARTSLPPLPGKGRGGGAPADASATRAAEPPPTLQDVHALTRDSDFTRFTRPGVAPEVRNAAMKKLFSDPHFNVMDGLDTYIGDYNTPDPLPVEWAKQLAGAKFLNLFPEEEKEEEARNSPDAGGAMEAGKKPAGGREVADDPTAGSVAQSGTAGPREPAVPPPAEPDADPDLRLQQDHAPGPPGPGQGDR
jgi:hypothetical protein